MYKKKIKRLSKKMEISQREINQNHYEKGVLRVVGEKISHFCKKYNLKVITINCENCNKKIKLNRPFYCSGYVGLDSKVCSCGTQNHVMVFEPVSKEKKQFWNQLQPEVFN